MTYDDLAHLIDASPMNRGMNGLSWLKVPGNFAFTSPAGDVFLFEKQCDDFYEFHWLHTVSKPRLLAEYTRDAFREMYDVPGAGLIYGLVPDNRRDSKLMARWIGAKSVGKTGTEHGICEMFILPRADLEKE